MDAQMNELIEAYKICINGSITDMNLRQSAFNYIENYKKTSENIIDVGFYLASQKESFELAHFGMQLISHTIKFKWNSLNEQTKFQIKNKLMLNLINENLSIETAPTYLKNSVCLVIIELIKREWPQNWPNLINELFEVSNRSLGHKRLVFVIFKYIAEEFIEGELNIPAQRRKDINQYLNTNMEIIFNFFLDNLENCYNCFESSKQENKPAPSEIIDLANTCLDSLSLYLNWFNINNIMSRNFSLINIILALLNHEKLCVNTSKCLISLVNRKGPLQERKPLMGLFSENVLVQFINCIKLSLENPTYQPLLKYLIQILVGMGFQLCSLWQSADFDRPQQLNIFLNAIYQIILCENKIYSNEAVQLWNSMLSNEFIQADKDIYNFLLNMSQVMTNSYLLFKVNPSSLMEEFDSEEDCQRFAHKYRNDLSKLIKTATKMYLEPFLTSAYDWSLKVYSETDKLDENDNSGYDPNSFLFMCWDALLYLWTNLMQVLSKKITTKSFKDEQELNLIKEKMFSLISTFMQFKSKNPNYTSYNLSIISCVLVCCELCDRENMDMVIKNIFEKLYNDYNLFKTESVNLINTTNSATINKYMMNVRRQSTANILNLCKTYSKNLLGYYEIIFQRLVEVINCSYTTQMERVILIQALIYCSNESSANQEQLQLTIINQFINPILEFFMSPQYTQSIKDINTFVAFLGLDESQKPDGLNNRKQIFYYVNALYGILKSINLPSKPSILVSNINESNLSKNKYKNTAYFVFFQLFEHIIDLMKLFHMLHATNLNINSEYMGMTEGAKSLALGMQATQPTVLNTDDSDKVLMFVYNTYDTLNQLIGLYLSKFKTELLLVEANGNQSNLEFIYKFGDAIFTQFNDIPNFRMRSIIRYVLKGCLSNGIDKEMIDKNLLIVKLNELLLEYFLPAILSRINESNKFYATLRQNDEPVNLKDKSNLQNQIIEENQFILMCRDLVDILRIFFTTQQQTSSSNADSEEMINNDDDDITENINITSNPNAGNIINELALHLIKNNKTIYQSVILILFEGLNWPDSFCCARLVRLSQIFIDKFQITNDPAASQQNNNALYLNYQVNEQIFTSCLKALQLHGEHNDIPSLLQNLSFTIYNKSSYEFKSQLNKVLSQIPNLNSKLFEEFLVKVNKSYMSLETNNPVNTNNEKLKKELYKKLTQPIIGKSLGQLFKNDIQINVLQPLNLIKAKKLNDGEKLETNICSLFDPNN